MPSMHYVKPAIKRPVLGFKSFALSLVPAPTLAPAFVAASNNNLFPKFIWTCIKKVQNQALAALVAPAVEVRDNINRSLKPQNPDLYYGHLHMECYYFC